MPPGPPPTTATLRPAAGAQLGQQGLKPALGGLQLLGADVDALVVGVAHALVLAAVGADGAGDEGQGVAVGDDAQGLLVLALAHLHQIGGNILLDGAAGAAGGGEAVDEGHLFVQLAAGDGLHGLLIVAVGGDALRQSGRPGRVHPLPGLIGDVRQGPADLAEPLVAAGLEDGGGHGDGPDARVKEGPHRVNVRAGGIGDAQWWSSNWM